jgi:uncharacterized membrane protein (TIGR02234 family)
VSGQGRRELGGALAGAVVAGGLALTASGQTWVTLTAVRRPPLPPVIDQVSGGQLAPLVTATGLLLLATAVALVATRGLGRVAVGLLAACAGAALAWSGFRVLVSGPGLDRALSSVGGSPGVRLEGQIHPAWPVLAAVAGVLAVAVGVLVVLRARDWPAMGRRYERPGAGQAAPKARPTTAEDRATAAWRALDHGVDPTAEPVDDAETDPTDGPAADTAAGAEPPRGTRRGARP